MQRKSRYWSLFPLVIAITLAVLIILGGCQKEPRPLAVVNGRAITEKDVDARIGLERILNPETAEAEADTKAILELLIDEQLLLAASADLDVEVLAEDKEKELAGVKDYLLEKYQSETELDKVLDKYNITWEAIEDFAVRRATYRNIYQKVVADVQITDDAVYSFYEANKDMFKVGEQVNASHILVKERELAEELMERINAGEDFAVLAKEYSEDPGSQAAGGQLGYFPRGWAVPEFEAAAFNAEVGEVVGIVETVHGYHIIEVHDRKPGHTLSFEETAAAIKSHLQEQGELLAFKEFFTVLQADAKIEHLN
ncbi:MAG: peptidylprolyl isomerase [bacterium]